MEIRYILITVIFIFVFFVRLNQLGGFDEDYVDPELESLSFKMEDMRSSLDKQAQSLLPQPQAALLSGMVLGVKTSLPPEFKKALQDTSTIHIVVVSGQNLTLLSGFIMTLAKFLGRKKTILLTLGINVFYAVLTGFQVPVIRAAIMVGFASIAQLFNRQGESVWILVFTAFLMLIYNPNWLFSLSFQLSFLATIGVVSVAPIFIASAKRLPELLKEDLMVSLAAFLMTLPVIANSFHRVSLIGVLVNSLVLWTVSLVMISGAITLLVSFIFYPFGLFLSIVPNVLLTYFVYMIEVFNQSWASVYVQRLHWSVWIGYYTLVLAAIIFLKQKSIKKEED